MSALMSAYGTLLATGLDNFWSHYLANWVRNWPVALFVQLVIAGPLVRVVHSGIFKKSKLVE